MAWLGTEQSSALNGRPGNVSQLTSELDELGVLDRRLSFYIPLRLREFARMGFSGFEGRYYSLFPSYRHGLAPAADLQQFLLMFCFQLALSAAVTAEQIPDDPTSESERRQPFFFAAAGLPAFYVRKNSGNELLWSVLSHCKKVRSSRRHPGYLRVPIRDYREALVTWMRLKGRKATELFDGEPLLGDLCHRLSEPERLASERVTASILHESRSRDPLQWKARDFNLLAEQHYRDGLRREHLREAFQEFKEDVEALQRADSEVRQMLRHGVRVEDPVRFLRCIEERLVRDELSVQEITLVLNLLLVLITQDNRRSRAMVI